MNGSVQQGHGFGLAERQGADCMSKDSAEGEDIGRRADVPAGDLLRGEEARGADDGACVSQPGVL
ncbi:hypothetical protein AMK28_24900 [Streptomyces sp. CB02115]|nr:hypothetical protein AMK28_24900 [Streptomyces sp. CB02115]